MALAAPGRALADACAQLRFDQAVPRRLAHRRAVSEVFVTDSTQLGEDEFALAIQLPRAHSLWFDRAGPHHDPLAVLEASRQGTFVIVHRHLGVSVGPPFTLRRFEFRVLDPEAFRDDGRSPLEAVWHAHLSDVDVREEILVGMGMHGALLVDGAPAATLEGEVTMLPQREYELIRSSRRMRAAPELRAAPPLHERLDPRTVGRRDPRNVVVGAAIAAGEGFELPLLVDEGHPSFYDHPQDHVPGPLMFEAFRQSALVAAVETGALDSPRAVLTLCAASFADFCEPDVPASCVARVRGSSRQRIGVEVELRQFGQAIGTGEIELGAQA